MIFWEVSIKFLKRRHSILSPWPMFRELLGKFAFQVSLKFCYEQTSQKPLKNHGQIMNKSTKKTCCVSKSLVSRFGVDWRGFGTPKCESNCGLGALLGRLGELLGHLEDDLGCTWGVLGALERSWGALGALWGVFWLDFLTIWADFWLILDKFGATNVSNMSKVCRTHRMQFTRAIRQNKL